MRKRKLEALVLLLISFYSLFRYFSSPSGSREDQKDTINEEEPPPWWALSPLWVEDQKPHINPHKFGFLINQPNICRGHPSLDLLILVTSAVSHYERRYAIRQTWASNLESRKAKIVFLLGQGHDQQTKIQSESQDYQDIIQEDFQDTYHNLTLKTMMGLKWASIFCSQAKFVLKTDDDIYVNVHLLSQALRTEEAVFSSKIVGCIKNSPLNSPLPIPKYEGGTSKLELPSISLAKPALPEFAAGAGYLLPGKYIPDLYLASLATKLIPVEDAYTTGFIAKKIDLHPPQNDRRFSCGQLVGSDCDMVSQFTGHKVEPERMYSIHEKLTNKLCSL